MSLQKHNRHILCVDFTSSDPVGPPPGTHIHMHMHMNMNIHWATTCQPVPSPNFWNSHQTSQTLYVCVAVLRIVNQMLQKQQQPNATGSHTSPPTANRCIPALAHTSSILFLAAPRFRRIRDQFVRNPARQNLLDACEGDVMHRTRYAKCECMCFSFSDLIFDSSVLFSVLSSRLCGVNC